MSCKGLVELIVLNIGLQAKILSQRTFTIFVVMALVTTFVTTPLTAALYPPWYQKKLEAWKRGEIDWDTGRPYDAEEDDAASSVVEKMEASQINRMIVYLRLDSMPALLALTSILAGANQVSPNASDENGTAISESTPPMILLPKINSRPIELHGVRLLQLTERESFVMKFLEADDYSSNDPVVNTFRAFGRLHSVFVSGEVAIVPETTYAHTLTTRASEMSSDIILLPWSETGSMNEAFTLSSEAVQNRLSSTGPYQQFVMDVLKGATCHVGVFIEKDFGGGSSSGHSWNNRRESWQPYLSPTSSAVSTRGRPNRKTLSSITQANRNHRIFLPYFGTADDHVATRFVLQLARDPRVTVRIVHFKVPTPDTDARDLSLSPSAKALATTTMPVDSSHGISRGNKPGKAASSGGTSTTTTERGLPLHEPDAVFLGAMRTSLAPDVAERVTIDSVMVEDADSLEAESVYRTVVECAAQDFGGAGNNAGDLVVIGRNYGAGAGCLGRLGERIAEGVEAGLLVIQAGVGR